MRASVVNKILVIAFALVVAWICIMPWGQMDSHSMADTSYKNYKGVLSKPVSAVYHMGEDVTLPEGTEIIYRFSDNGEVIFYALYTEENMSALLVEHEYTQVMLTKDDLQNPEQVESNYQDHLVKEKAKSEENRLSESENGFSSSRVLVGILVGILVMCLLFLAEDKFAKPQVFTIIIAVLFVLAVVLVLLGGSRLICR